VEKKEAPWIAIEALYNSLNNWKRQYGAEIQVSMKYLRTSLTPIANLNSQSEALPAVFGENTPKVLGYAQKAEAMKAIAENRAEKEKLDILDVIALKDDVQGFLGIANDVLNMLYTGLISDEEAIDRLLPTKDYLWEKNSTLRERLKKATETLANPSNYKINQIMENLPQYLSYVDEAVQTLAVYSERKEFLLNYPLAVAAIEERLKVKEQLLPQDLPFQPRFAAEYLRLYYTQRFGEYAFDKENFVLTKRP
jgi:DNA repair ATPase RecN